MKTSTKKAISKKEVAENKSYNILDMDKRYSVGYQAGMDDCHAYLDEVGVDNATDIDVPLHLRGGEWVWNFQKKTPLVDKITWVLTAMNIAILAVLIAKNV